MTRLALFLDGTWNDPDDRTNVKLLADALAGPTHGVPDQLSKYIPGVGIKWHERISGGAFGKGLSANVAEAYEWLHEKYNDDDEIYLFGFSRGAYTARSVAGVIILCGLLRRGGALDCKDIYKRYRAGKDKLPLHQIMYLLDHPDHPDHARLTDEDRLLAANSRRVPIRFIGVWDTVGALGVPWTSVPLIGRGNFYFHNTNLSVLVQAAFQALAIDEHRGPYKPTLWNTYTKQGSPPAPMPSRDQVEQRWFVGAHANVGGGYGHKDLLPGLPLAWIQSRAAANGLKFHTTLTPSPNAIQCAPRDSFAEFMKGFYRLVRLGKKFYRTIGRGPYPVRGGTATPINEVIDASVFKRWQAHSNYRPKALEDSLQGKVNPLTQQGDLYL